MDKNHRKIHWVALVFLAALFRTVTADTTRMVSETDGIVGPHHYLPSVAPFYSSQSKALTSVVKGRVFDRTYEKAEIMGDDYEYVSFKSPKTIVAETVYHFFRGGLYGAAFGLVTPFYEAGTQGAIREAKTSIFRPAPVFGSLSSVPSNALIFGSLLAMQRFTCKSAEFLRGKQDPWNDVAGCLVAYPYYQTCLTKHAVLHNRVVGGLLLASIAFANAP